MLMIADMLYVALNVEIIIFKFISIARCRLTIFMTGVCIWLIAQVNSRSLMITIH